MPGGFFRVYVNEIRSSACTCEKGAGIKLAKRRHKFYGSSSERKIARTTVASQFEQMSANEGGRLRF